MRWPLRRQLLLPVLSVVLVAIIASSVLTAWLQADRATRRVEENLLRVLNTLTASGFPLTDSVLMKMRGLSGADFLVFDNVGKINASTIELPVDELDQVRSLPLPVTHEALWSQPELLIRGRTYLTARVLVGDDRTGSSSLSLVVLYPEEERSLANRQAVVVPLTVGLVAALVVALVVTILARRVVRPIEALQKRAQVISSGDFRRRDPPTRNDEIRDLSLAINDMAERLENHAEELRRSERLRTLGQLGGALAHQLRNFATGARLALDFHQRDCRHDASDDSLAVASRQLKLMERYLQRFLRLGQPRAVSTARVSLRQIVEEVLPLVEPTCRHAKVELSFQPNEAPPIVRGDADALQQMLTNLLLNAVEAARGRPEGQRQVIVELAQSAAGKATLSVRDSGQGPAAEVAGRLFEPFITEKPDGTGLGLSVAREIATEHGGTIEWQRAENLTSFVVQLPVIACEEPHGPIACCR